MIWIIEGRAVDQHGNGTLWRWRSPESGQLPNDTERTSLEGTMGADFFEVFHHNPTHVKVAVLPRCGEKLSKIPVWRTNPGDGRWGLHVDDDWADAQEEAHHD